MISRSFFLAACVLCAVSSTAYGVDLRLAVASNFSQTIASLVSEFERQTGATVSVSLGASGALYAQIRHGAPYDVFLSADQEKPQALIDMGLAQPNKRFTYAMGSLLLWQPSAEDAQLEARLLKGELSSLAMANPELAPYGRAAQQVLDALNVESPRRVIAENISQAYQFVASGNVDAGFIARAQYPGAEDPSSGAVWMVPNHLYTPIQQDAVWLDRADANAMAGAFMVFLHSDLARSMIEQAGYLLPPDVSIDAAERIATP